MVPHTLYLALFFSYTWQLFQCNEKPGNFGTLRHFLSFSMERVEFRPFVVGAQMLCCHLKVIVHSNKFFWWDTVFAFVWGEGSFAGTTDGVYSSSCSYHFPDRWRNMERTEREKGSSDGWHLNWSFCTVLDPFLHHRINKSPLFLQHPASLEKHLSLAWLLKFFL